YDPERKKIIISRDVVFEESKGWNWKNSDKKEEQSSNNDILSDEEIDTSSPTIADDNTHENVSNEIQVEKDMNTSSDESGEILVNLPPRARRPPQSLNDFVTGNELDQIDELHNLA
ncbi:hypothetical protein L195_g061847, partial [Trifolium pratense]